MLTLFIDTHASTIRLALVFNNKLLREITVNEKLDHSTVCMPTLVKLMEEEKKTVKDLTDIVVVNGPGSFTGERLGVTIAKTLAFTLNIPIRTITSIETCLASINFAKDTYLSLSEKNGYFLALFNSKKELIDNYFYISKSEYDEFVKAHNVLLVNDYDILNSVLFAQQKEAINPHLVNPFYVKQLRF